MLKTKNCIITGASRGIGREIAIKLSNLDEVNNFVLISRDREKLLETKSLMNDKCDVTIAPIDLQNEKDLIDIVQKTYQKDGKIDILINGAGYVNPKSLLETDLTNWEETFKINVTSMFLLTREVVRYMKKKGGKILNIASTAGMTPRPGWVAYSASKAAVISLSETLANELEEYGIKVYCVSPGRCATDLRKILAPEEDPSTIMQPEEVADVVYNLISNMGDCLDGQNIIIRKQIMGES